MNTIEVLKAARELLVTKGWTQGIGARDADGEGVGSEDPQAVCYCGYGAIWAAAGSASHLLAENAINEAAGFEPFDCTAFFDWNDEPGRAVDEVLAVFDKAIAAEEAKEA